MKSNTGPHRVRAGTKVRPALRPPTGTPQPRLASPPAALERARVRVPGIEVHGHIDSRFLTVREVFRENFARGELGAGCAVVLDGQSVVDVSGG